MANSCSQAVPAGCSPAVTGRVLDNFTRRFNTATRQALVTVPGHPTNNDLSLADKCASYSKAVRQTSPGRVDLAAFAKLQAAIASGKWMDFEAVPLGNMDPAGRLNGPMDAFASTFMGADSSLFGASQVPAPWGVTSKEYATELIELYWASLLRDVSFADYATNVTAAIAAQELSHLASLGFYKGPTDGSGKVTPELLMRGIFPGEIVGPYISQLLVKPTVFGSAPLDQRYVTYRAGVDYMTDQDSWFKVQQGLATGFTNQQDSVPRWLHDGRGLAAWTHVDELYQAYFTAYLVLSSMKMPTNPGNPYRSSKTQKPFGTFGGPDVAALLGQVAKYALGAVWYQKWVIHLRHRPEAAGGLVHLIEAGESFDAEPDPLIFDSEALAASFTRFGSYLLSQPFPEGSPTHPAYPTGHGTVGGACITLLKFFFDGDATFPNPVMPSFDGTALVPWLGQPGTGALPTNAAKMLDVNGELHKLAHNITFGHGLHGGIHWRSDSDSSMRLGEAVALSFLEDLVCTYKEPFSISIKLLDGSTRTFTNP